MAFTPTAKPSTTHISEVGRHTYGKESGKTTRIRFGDHVRYGGSYYGKSASYTDQAKPTTSQTAQVKPSTSSTVGTKPTTSYSVEAKP